MTLAGMIRLNEDALICDFAETYHVYDYRSLPLRTAATLSAGLRDNSRIKLCAAGAPVALEIILLAGIADRIDAIKYGLSSDSDRAKRPPFLVETILGEAEKNQNGAQVFNSAEAFKEAYAKARGIE